jgi:hypothetical protein
MSHTIIPCAIGLFPFRLLFRRFRGSSIWENEIPRHCRMFMARLHWRALAGSAVSESSRRRRGSAVTLPRRPVVGSSRNRHRNHRTSRITVAGAPIDRATDYGSPTWPMAARSGMMAGRRCCAEQRQPDPDHKRGTSSSWLPIAVSRDPRPNKVDRPPVTRPRSPGPHLAVLRHDDGAGQPTTAARTPEPQFDQWRVAATAIDQGLQVSIALVSARFARDGQPQVSRGEHRSRCRKRPSVHPPPRVIIGGGFGWRGWRLGAACHVAASFRHRGARGNY